MALGTGHFTGASGDLDVMIPEVWGQKMNDFFREDLVLGSFFTDRSDELAGGGDTVHTPNITEMSANAKSNGSEVTLNSPTETDVDLVVNTWAEVSFLIEDREAAQVKKSWNIQNTYARNAAYTCASEIEDAIAALFAGFSSTVGASTTSVADSEIRIAIATLRAANIPGVKSNSSEVAFFMHPNTIWRQVMALDKFALVQNTLGADPVLKGAVGYLYGIPVIESTNLVHVASTNGRYNALAHKDAIHWARLTLPSTPNSFTGDMGVRMQTNYIPEYLGFLTTADVVYGVIENRDSAGVAILSHATNA